MQGKSVETQKEVRKCSRSERRMWTTERQERVRGCTHWQNGCRTRGAVGVDDGSFLPLLSFLPFFVHQTHILYLPSRWWHVRYSYDPAFSCRCVRDTPLTSLKHDPILVLCRTSLLSSSIHCHTEPALQTEMRYHVLMIGREISEISAGESKVGQGCR